MSDDNKCSRAQKGETTQNERVTTEIKISNLEFWELERQRRQVADIEAKATKTEETEIRPLSFSQRVKQREEANAKAAREKNERQARETQRYHCCGIEFVRTKPKVDHLEILKTDCDDCLKMCRENAVEFSSPCCFYNVSRIAIYVTLMSLAIYLIATRQQVINECREFVGDVRFDCMSEIKSTIAQYAWSFCLLFASVFGILRILLWLFHQTCRQWMDKPEEYKCVDGECNAALCQRILRIISFVLFFFFMFLTIYCSHFQARCDRDDHECTSVSNDGGYIAGLIFGVVGFSISIFLPSMCSSVGRPIDL